MKKKSYRNKVKLSKPSFLRTLSGEIIMFTAKIMISIANNLQFIIESIMSVFLNINEVLYSDSTIAASRQTV